MITLSALYAGTVALGWAVLTFHVFEWLAGNVVIPDAPLANPGDDLQGHVAD